MNVQHIQSVLLGDCLSFGEKRAYVYSRVLYVFRAACRKLPNRLGVPLFCAAVWSCIPLALGEALIQCLLQTTFSVVYASLCFPTACRWIPVGCLVLLACVPSPRFDSWVRRAVYLAFALLCTFIALL